MKSIIVLTSSLLFTVAWLEVAVASLSSSWFCALVGHAIRDYVTPLVHYLAAFSAAVFCV